MGNGIFKSRGVLDALGHSGATDAFARQRVAHPETIFDSKQLYDNAPLFWDDQQISGANTTSTHSPSRASSILAVAAEAGMRARQTFQRFNYQPGKSQNVIMTGILGDSATGITRRIGAFDANDGLFFEQDEDGMSVCVRSNTSGTVATTKVTQTDWNLDQLNGTGISGKILDPSKAQIFFIDYEWLGVGSVRFGFVIEGIVRYCHQFQHANKSTVVYTKTPNHPLRYEISNDGTGGTAQLECICSTVISEGGRQDLGIVRHVASGVDATLANTKTYAVIGLRLNSASPGVTVAALSTSLLLTSANDTSKWSLRLNPTVANTFTYSNVTNSAVQVAFGSNVNDVTASGTVIAGGVVSTVAPEQHTFENAIRLGSTIVGASDTLVLCVTPVSGTVSAVGTLTWREQV